MPPKRKAPRPSRAASTPSGDAVEQEAEGSRTPSNLKTTKDALPSDRWTDEQETSLFKGMIRWKPVGSFLFMQQRLRWDSRDLI